MNIDGVKAVFYGADFITVTKDADANWAHIRPEVFALITEAVTSGQKIVSVSEKKDNDGAEGASGEEVDSLAYDENDSEVVGMIKELLETRIRPAIQEDGGDIEFRGFENGNVMLKLRGACRTCDSSTVTLKNGIEGMLMHYVSCPRVKPFQNSKLTSPSDRGGQECHSGNGRGRRNCTQGICKVRGKAQRAEGFRSAHVTGSWIHRYSGRLSDVETDVAAVCVPRYLRRGSVLEDLKLTMSSFLEPSRYQNYITSVFEERTPGQTKIGSYQIKPRRLFLTSAIHRLVSDLLCTAQPELFSKGEARGLIYKGYYSGHRNHGTSETNMLLSRLLHSNGGRLIYWT